jgi:hypothetical protein
MKYYYNRDTKTIVCSIEELASETIKETTFDTAQWFKMKPLIDKLDRHRNQKDFGIATTITDQEATTIAQELQSLREKTEGDQL